MPIKQNILSVARACFSFNTVSILKCVTKNNFQRFKLTYPKSKSMLSSRMADWNNILAISDWPILYLVGFIFPVRGLYPPDFNQIVNM